MEQFDAQPQSDWSAALLQPAPQINVLFSLHRSCLSDNWFAKTCVRVCVWSVHEDEPTPPHVWRILNEFLSIGNPSVCVVFLNLRWKDEPIQTPRVYHFPADCGAGRHIALFFLCSVACCVWDDIYVNSRWWLKTVQKSSWSLCSGVYKQEGVASPVFSHVKSGTCCDLWPLCWRPVFAGDMGVGKSCLLHQFTEKKCEFPQLLLLLLLSVWLTASSFLPISQKIFSLTHVTYV